VFSCQRRLGYSRIFPVNFDESVKYLYALGNEVEAMKLGLENIRTLLAALGDPQNNFLKVQVAGTNGKGSVCAFLNSICLTAAVKTGMYTSPHLVSITERVQINGVDISEDEFARLATHVREIAEKLLADGVLEYRLTFFEQVTAIALIAFADAKVELAILETGLGGRLDATTAANAEIAAITRIDLDHQEYLGDAIEEIAEEKAAIIRSDSLVCIGLQQPEALAVIVKKCDETGAELHTLDSAKFGPDSSGAEFYITGSYFGEVMLLLEGEHQIENAALAILIAKQLGKTFPISDINIIDGLERTRHPGRLEWLVHGNVRILLDGAHNKAGADALSRYLRKWHPEARIALVYGSLKDKDYQAILNTLLPLSTDIILTEPSNTRSIPATQLVDSSNSVLKRDSVFMVPEVEQALDAAIQLAETYPRTKQSFVLVTGSLYLVGEVKKILQNDSET
jgi:dihydrofolate synthase/folylpolyglutamate synthase